jgi:hypothetical protein
MAQLAAVALALLGGLLDRQPRDAGALKAAVQSATAEVGDGVPLAAQHIVQGQHGFPPEGHDNGLFGLRQHRAFRASSPIGASAIVVRLRHLRTVVGFRP